MTERPASSGAMAADSPAMPLPTTSTSTSDEKLTSGFSKTRGPSSSEAAGASGDGTAPDEQAAKPPPAATTAPAPTSLKNARRSMRRRLL